MPARPCDRRIEAVRAVGALAAARDADAVLVAGDAFDANAVADATLFRMLDALKAFDGTGSSFRAITTPSRIRYGLACTAWEPDNVHLAQAPERPLPLAGGRAFVLPAVLERRHEVDDPTAWFDGAATPEGAVRIGLAHGSVPERLPEASEAPNPIAANRAETARLDYLALGDWHGTFQIDARTWYSGTPEPDRFQSRDPGNALVVTVHEPGAPPDVETIRTGHFSWRTETAEIRGSEDVEALDRMIEGLSPEPDRCLLRLTLTGAAGLAARHELRVRLERWAALLRHLDVRDDGLVAEPSDDDMDRIDRGGFVRKAVERLRDRARDEADPEREAAAMALVRLYETHLGAGG